MEPEGGEKHDNGSGKLKWAWALGALMLLSCTEERNAELDTTPTVPQRSATVGVDDGQPDVESSPELSALSRHTRGIRSGLQADEPTVTPLVEVTQEPPPAPTEAPVYTTYPVGSIEAYICSLDWPCGVMVCIAARESGTDANGALDGWYAVNTYDGDAKGLFQIRESVHASKWSDWATGWYDPIRGTQYAYDLYLTSGLGPWYAQSGVCF